MATLLGAAGSAAAQAATSPMPRGVVAWKGSAAEVEFHASGDVALLIARGPQGTMPIIQVATVSDALRILADRRLSFAWPALLAWAGADLSILRDRALARTKLAYEIGLVSGVAQSQTEEFSGSAQLTATLQYAAALRQAGFRAESLKLLRGRIAAIDVSGGDELAMQKVLLAVRLGNMLSSGGDDATAIATLEDIAADPLIAARWRLNAEVNLAQALLTAGQYQRALTTIESAWKSFGVQQEADLAVPGSDANFTRIKACALDGLGQHDKARALLAGMTDDENDFATTTSVSAAVLQADFCMRDSAAAARQVAVILGDVAPADKIFADIQPAGAERRESRDILIAMVGDPRLRKPLAEVARVLPVQFDAAQNAWKNRAIDGTPPPR